MSEKMLSLLGYRKPTSVLGIVENRDPAGDLEGAWRVAGGRAGEDEDGEAEERKRDSGVGVKAE